MIESWMINLFLGLVTFAAAWGYTKSRVQSLVDENKTQFEQIEALQEFKNKNQPVIDHLSKVEEAYGKKIDMLGKEVVELKTKLANVPTMEQVRSEFVTKEMFKQMEKHIDEKFGDQKIMLGKILDKLEDSSV